jgi:glycosyltransferase involved in cell wall biosynthesis
MVKLGNIIKAVAKKMNINFYLPLCLAKSEQIPLDAAKVAFAKDELNRYSKDANTSCIADNKIDTQVDLQIIIPAYNVEKYICECIDSIVLPPKGISYIITVINDGSTDRTGELLKTYNNISNVEIITQRNKGFSGARNAGLATIKGRYIAFVDSDDWIDWAVLEKMVKNADKNDSDMVEADFFITDESGKLKSKVKSNPAHPTGFLWGKIFKGKKWSNFALPEGYWYEDTIMEQILLEDMKNKSSLSEVVYYYRQNSKGITATSRNRKKSVDSLWILLALHKDREKLRMPTSQKYYEFVLRHSYLTYSRTKYQEEEVRRKILLILSDFINNEFKDYHCENKKMRILEEIIRSADYGKWKAFCEWVSV